MIQQKTQSLAVTREALARRAAARAGVEEEAAVRLVSAFLEELKDALLSGERADLDGLFDLGVVVEPARIRRDSGGRFAEIAPARSRLDIQVGGDLEARLSTQRTAAVLLALPGQCTFGQILKEHFERLGWQVQRADSAEACERALGGARPYLLVCDHTFPDRDAFVQSLKTTWRTNTVPVVTLHTRGEDPRHPARLSVLGDLAVEEPIEIHPFLRAVDHVLAQASEEAAVFERQLRYRTPAREEEILQAFDLTDSFFKDAGFRGDALVGLTTAFREAVRNAEIHGCNEDARCAIAVEVLLDKEKITLTVEDEGEGFDHKSYRKALDADGPVSMARARHKAGAMGGLGIYLMERCVERLAYNDAGNRVTLTKYREREEGRHAS